MTHIRQKQAAITLTLDELKNIQNIMLDGMLGWEMDSYLECLEDSSKQPASGSVSAALKFEAQIESLQNQPALVVTPVSRKRNKAIAP